MEQIHSRTCSAEQAAALIMKNAWRHALIGSHHLRIHPPTSDVSTSPQGWVRYVATLEFLDAADAPWGECDSAGIEAVKAVFRSLLE
jgi:hypothetical protein